MNKIEWKDVREETPTENKKYLCLSSEGDMTTKYWRSEAVEAIGTGFAIKRYRNDTWYKVNVVAWAELPEPPAFAETVFDQKRKKIESKISYWQKKLEALRNEQS